MFGLGHHAELNAPGHKQSAPPCSKSLLVERLGVGGGGSDVSVTGGLVGAGGELEGGSGLEVVVARGGVRGGVVLLEVEVSKLGEHCSNLG